MEIWDLYNRDREIIGEHIRGRELPPDGYHLVVHVWIRNQSGQYLMTQRSANRPSCPLKWECVGGSALKGEGSLAAALREVQEEVGLRLSGQEARLITTQVRTLVEGKRINDLVDVYGFDYDGPVDLAQATTDEVAQVRWMDPREIAALFDAGHQGSVVFYGDVGVS